MIDFRYHLVSLISVFMALAIGVILGAGPLRDAIGSQLDEQITQLRDDKNELRDQLDLAEGTIEHDSNFVQALAPDLLAGQLEGKGVAIVNLDGAGLLADGIVAGLEGAIELAGGHVTTVVHLESNWADPEQAGARTATAERLADEIDGWVPSDQPEEVLARALGQALTQANILDTTSRSEQALVLEQVLVESSFIQVGQEDSRPADVVLAITSRGPVAVDVELETADEFGAVTMSQVYTVRGFAGITPTVVAGPVSRGDDLIARLVGESLPNVSTYSGMSRTPGLVAIPLVLANALHSTYGDFGEGENAGSPIPQRVEISDDDISTVPDPVPDPDADGVADEEAEDAPTEEGEE